MTGTVVASIGVMTVVGAASIVVATLIVIYRNTLGMTRYDMV